MVGEKYLNPDNHATGKDYPDDHPMLVGDDYDMYSWSFNPPMQDRQGYVDLHRWGMSTRPASTSPSATARCG